MHSHWKRLQTGLPAWFREALNLEAPTFTTSYCLDWKILGILGRQTSEAHFVSLGPHHRAYPILSPCGSTQGPGNRIHPNGSTKSNQPKGITSNPAHLVLFHHRGLESGLSLATLWRERMTSMGPVIGCTPDLRNKTCWFFWELSQTRGAKATCYHSSTAMGFYNLPPAAQFHGSCTAHRFCHQASSTLHCHDLLGSKRVPQASMKIGHMQSVPLGSEKYIIPGSKLLPQDLGEIWLVWYLTAFVSSEVFWKSRWFM